MATTRENIRQWLETGREKGAAFMIVATDTFDWEDYPVYVPPGLNPREAASKHEKVMECYELAKDWDEQLGAHRSFNWGDKT